MGSLNTLDGRWRPASRRAPFLVGRKKQLWQREGPDNQFASCNSVLYIWHNHNPRKKINHYKLGPWVPPKLLIKTIILLLLSSPHIMVTMFTFHLASEVLQAASVDTSATDNTSSWRKNWINIEFCIKWGQTVRSHMPKTTGWPRAGFNPRPTPVWCTPTPSNWIKDDNKSKSVQALLLQSFIN